MCLLRARTETKGAAPTGMFLWQRGKGKGAAGNSSWLSQHLPGCGVCHMYARIMGKSELQGKVLGQCVRKVYIS